MAVEILYLLSDDLIDSGKTIGFARALGLQTKQFRTAQSLLLTPFNERSLTVVDLQLAGDHLAELLRIHRRVVGYGSHVAADRLREARHLGCERVMPRSVYFADLATKLPEWLDPPVVEQTPGSTGTSTPFS